MLYRLVVQNAQTSVNKFLSALCLMPTTGNGEKLSLNMQHTHNLYF